MSSAGTKLNKTVAAAEPLAREVLEGLLSKSKAIAPKYFYDQKGSALFDAITELDEYYVTRTEEQIIKGNRASICAAAGIGALVVEPGAGSCEKIRWLLPDLQPAAYVPMDISREHLHASAASLSADFPDLKVLPQVIDHTNGLKLSSLAPDAPPVFFYPGSSIGNFEPDDAQKFLHDMRAVMDDEGGLLIGVDTQKDPRVLNRAYNDSAGVTASFNLNVLDHLNNLLEGDLQTENFIHKAHYDEKLGRIEMHLQCKRRHSAVLAGERIEFDSGELIHTENSYKYRPEDFAGLAAAAGFRLKNLWQDDSSWFSVMYFEAC